MNMDKVSYALGLSIANNLKNNGIDTLDIASFQQAVADVMNNDPLAVTPEEASTVLNEYFTNLQAKRDKEAAKESVENEAAGKAYMEENAKKDTVKTTASGLQYEILKEGSGKKPTIDDTVSCHYHGTLIDGTVFDSSVQRGQPAQFPLNGVIAGWTEILQLMPVGSKWRVTIPANLAYGDRGAGNLIKPGATLIFDIDLLDIV